VVLVVVMALVLMLVVVVLVLVVVALLLVALLLVAFLGAPLQPIQGPFGSTLLRSCRRQDPDQGQTGHQPPQQPAAGPALGDRPGQGIEGGGIHWRLLAPSAALTPGQGQPIGGPGAPPEEEPGPLLARQRTSVKAQTEVASSRFTRAMIAPAGCVGVVAAVMAAHRRDRTEVRCGRRVKNERFCDRRQGQSR
jgi:hypothetical protein